MAALTGDPSVRRRAFAGLAGWLTLCFAAGGIGAIGSADAPLLYPQLARPAWAPPAWVLPVVWSILYVAMAVAAWLVWRSQRTGRNKAFALGLFVAQLVANALWSWLFFAWRLGGAAFAESLVMAALIAWTSIAFRPFSRVASLLMLPYLLWVVFASALTWALWRANPAVFG